MPLGSVLAWLSWEVEAKPLVKGLLATEDVFVLDTLSELYIWVGQGCTKDEKKADIRCSQNLSSKLLAVTLI